MAIGNFISLKPRFQQRGFSFLGLMILIAIIGIGLGRAGTVWQTEVEREKKHELKFAIEQFRQAISSYYESTPNGVKQYPPTLEDMLHDPRFPEIRRHLRKIYTDPMTGNSEWGLVKEKERIVDVYSLTDINSYPRNSNGPVNNLGTQTLSNGVLTNVQVPVPVVDINQTANSPAPEPPPDDPCISQATSENAVCIEVCMQGGFDICAACYDSVKARMMACKQKKDLPSLITK